MKRLLLIFILVWALSACENDFPVDNQNNTSKPIAFNVAETRAEFTTEAIAEKGFGIYAFVNTGEDGTPGASVFESLLGNENGAEKIFMEDGKWTYEHTQFWEANRLYQFVGVYPFDTKFNITKDISGNPTGVSRTFTTPDTADKEDFILARATYDTSVSIPEKVDIEFQHMLTNLNVKVWRDGAKHQNDQMRVKKVTLSNIRKTGTYSSASNSWDVSNENKMTMVYNTPAAEKDDDNIGVAITRTDGSWAYSGDASTPFSDLLLIPQSTYDASIPISLKIEYQLRLQGAVDWDTKELEVVLPTITWKAGQKYTYNVVLSSVTYITVYYIQTTVDPWGTPQVGGTVIIK